MNPYDPPQDVATVKGDAFASPPVQPAVRIYAGIVTLSGVGFVPAALFPLMTPGIFVWIGWLMIVLGQRRIDTLPFWWFSLGWNVFTFYFLIWLRGGYFGPIDLGMIWVWIHLLTAMAGSGVILLFKYEARRIENENPPRKAEQ